MSRKRSSQEGEATSAERLESWKEIAAYLRRGVRTVRRWEKDEGLPVHRHLHKKLGSVYAYRSELDRWREGTSRGREAPGDAARRPGRSDSERVMVAVLPFRDLSRDPHQEYFSDGLTEEIISQLSRLQPELLAVIARTTMMQYKGSDKTVQQIGAELKLDYVLEGSVRVEAERVRVTARLIEVRDQTPLWCNTYDESMRSILAVQRELAADIGREIRLKLSPQQAACDRAVVDPDAYRAYLKGRHLLNSFTPASVRRSVAFFRTAINGDPTHAPFYASLAEAYERLPIWSNTPPRTTFPLALDAAEKALELDPSLPGAYASLGLIHANYLWDWRKAERLFQRALELDPGCSQARQWYAEFLAQMGRSDDALVTLEPARVSDPLSSVVQSTRAFVLLLDRRFDEAIEQAKQVLEIDAQYPMALIRLGLAYAGKKSYADAIAVFEAAESGAPGLLDCVALQGYAFALAGKKKAALGRLEALQALAATQYVPPFLFSDVYLGLGEYDEVVRLMEEEYDSRGWYMLLLKQAHQFDPLRTLPRFQALVNRMAFPA